MPEKNLEIRRPQPPEKPLPGDCCDTGCEVCVFDAYSDALADYQRELSEWQARQNQAASAEQISDGLGKRYR